MEVKFLNKKDFEVYSNLSKKYGSVFSYMEWLNIFGKNLHILGLYDKGNNLIGGFAIYIKKIGPLRICTNPPFSPNIGLFLKIKDIQNKVTLNSFIKMVIESISEFLEKNNFHIISLNFPRQFIDMQPFIWKKFKVIPRYTYIISLDNSEEDIWKHFSSTRRRYIRKALREKIECFKLERSDFNIIKILVEKTFLRKNKKINLDLLNKIIFSFANDENSFAFASFKNNRPIAVSFCIYDNFSAYYLLGGIDPEVKHHGAGALSLYNCIKYAKQLKLKYFDFEGSTIPSIERFFRDFGGDLVPYFRVNKALLPLEIVLKFLKRDLF
ncbi:MAG TPA: GNAT family N-acetyltransferase [Candidatus Desulfofervidus auxilii]|uniref:GNAT family N-acetyltransferase n=1 Tax=Desulfofervidus auxilii TaxID=1621989 RepID=A0A7C0Y6H3_DESA2|nr:GNAT family N-acetyltransferase [Candidatus Desulfofervidus auxilii]